MQTQLAPREHRLPLRTRLYDDATDRAFVISSWVRSYEHTLIGGMLGAHYQSRWTEVVRRLLETSTTHVATSEADPDVLIGFACVAPPATIHYLFVKPFARRKGVAQLLLSSAGITTPFVTTHRTIDVERIAQQHRGLLRFDLTRIWLP